MIMLVLRVYPEGTPAVFLKGFWRKVNLRRDKMSAFLVVCENRALVFWKIIKVKFGNCLHILQAFSPER